MEIPVCIINKREQEPMSFRGECYDNKTVCCTSQPIEFVRQQPTNVVCKNLICEVECQKPTETVSKDLICEVECQKLTEVTYQNVNRYTQNGEFIKVIEECYEPQTFMNKVQQLCFNGEYFDEKKHWFTTVDLENEFNTMMTLLELSTIKAEVEPIERLLKLCVVRHGLRRNFRLPQTINVNFVRVHLLKDTKKIVIVAPWTRQTCMNVEQQMMIQNVEENKCFENKIWEMMAEEQLMNVEPMMYNWMQQVRCQLPKFVTLRGVRRHTITGELALCLELIKEKKQFRMLEQLHRVLLNKLTRTLIIEEAMCEQFQQMQHHIQLPTCIDQERIRLNKMTRYNNTIMQLELPIVKINKNFNRMF